MTPHAILFGASGGIATALRNRLVDHHWNVTAVTRSPDKIEAGDSVQVLQGDGTREEDVKNAFEEAEEFGQVHAVVNLVGNVMLKPIHRTSAAEFSEVMRLHVFGSYLILHQACSRLSEGSSVALVSSVAVQTGLPNHESISAAKGAVEGLVRSAAATYAGKGIRVNAVAPGLTETPATAHLCTSPAREVSVNMHPLGRIGTPDDVASALAWLVDPAQSWVTGQILHVDGGLGDLRGMPGKPNR